MPRKSQASLSVLAIVPRANRLKPPPAMSEPARSAFIDLVSSCKPGHFQQSDMTLLVRYVEASILADRAEEHLRTEGAVIAGRVSPWIVVQEKAVRALTALSMRLRLSPQARQPNNSGTRQPPISHYDRMKIDDQD